MSEVEKSGASYQIYKNSHLKLNVGGFTSVFQRYFCAGSEQQLKDGCPHPEKFPHDAYKEMVQAQGGEPHLLYVDA